MAYPIYIAVDGALSSVSLSTTDGLILAKNLGRKGGVVFNDSSGSLYIGLSTTTVSTATFTAMLGTNTYYQIPTNYVGQIRGILAATITGSARVTELT